MLTLPLILMGSGLLAGLLLAFFVFRLVNRRGGGDTTITISGVAQRVQAVGKLVGLEVNAKEIATATKGWSWLPPMLLSQARLAMIFHFEQQYAVDLARITADDIEDLGVDDRSGRRMYKLTLPALDVARKLTDVVPYDIQDGRVLGLLDVIQMNAPTQHELMRRAQQQAAGLFAENEDRYHAEARSSVERQLRTLLAMFDVDVRLAWRDRPGQAGFEPAELNESDSEPPLRLAVSS